MFWNSDISYVGQIVLYKFQRFIYSQVIWWRCSNDSV
jgi:hypothetical protein